MLGAFNPNRRSCLSSRKASAPFTRRPAASPSRAPPAPTRSHTAPGCHAPPPRRSRWTSGSTAQASASASVRAFEDGGGSLRCLCEVAAPRRMRLRMRRPAGAILALRPLFGCRVGMLNVGNTCYMASVIQALTYEAQRGQQRRGTRASSRCRRCSAPSRRSRPHTSGSASQATPRAPRMSSRRRGGATDRHGTVKGDCRRRPAQPADGGGASTNIVKVLP